MEARVTSITRDIKCSRCRKITKAEILDSGTYICTECFEQLYGS